MMEKIVTKQKPNTPKTVKAIQVHDPKCLKWANK